MKQDEQPPSYDSAFFQALEEGVARSAASGADLIMELIAPKSVIDVGCGTCLWLAALRSRGVTDILGVDGSWVPRDQLAIPEALFQEHNLTNPLALDRGFDLALCLEVAEHLPAEAAEPLVRSLTAAAPVVVFSAAIPGQGGDGHVNEQWPGYWADLFAAKEFRCFTGLRERLWHREAVEVWYRQNMLCFAAPTHALSLAQRLSPTAEGGAHPLDIVHPDLLARVRSDQARQGAYAARLERELQTARSELQTAISELQTARSELQRIRNSLPFRLYLHLRAAPGAARRFTGRASPSDRGRS
jgi:SAM-dependent methyltransferase